MLSVAMLGLVAPAAAQTLNPTGRDVSILAPLFSDQRSLGEVMLIITAADALKVGADGFLTLVGPRLTAAAQERLRAAADAEGYLSPEAIDAAGLALRYDPAELRLVLETPVDARAQRTLFVRSRDGRPEPQGERPSLPSLYVNAHYSLNALSDEIDADTLENAVLRLDGALSIPAFDHAALEANALVDGGFDAEIDTLRLTYDQPERRRRWRLGHVQSPSLGREGSESGVAVQLISDDIALSDSRSIVATGGETFRLERESEVRVFVNGRQVRRFLLEPGTYDLRDFPLNLGANDISVEIEDDTGTRELLNFSRFSAANLRPAGETVYAATLGALEAPGAQDGFDLDGWFAAGFYERGLTERWTLGGYAKASADAQVLGLTSTQVALGGQLDLEATGSLSDGDAGAGAQARYARNWFSGDKWRYPHNLTLTLGLYTEEFATALQSAQPRESHAITAGVSYARPFPGGWRFTAGAYADLAGFNGADDTLSGRVGLGRSFGRLSLSADLGYEHGGEEELFGFLRANWTIDPLSTLDSTYSIRNEELRATYSRRSDRRGVGSWNGSVTASYDRDDENARLGGNFGYNGNRGIVRLAHNVTLDEFDGDATVQRTSLDLETSVALVGDSFGIGRPIGSSFALVSGHKSLGGAPVYANYDRGDYTARSGLLGAGVVPALRDYRNAAVSLDVLDAPLGYDLGARGETLQPTYRSGFALEAGSAYSVTAIGILTDRAGEPVALRMGRAQALDDPEAPEVEVFTNRAGRFAMVGIGPGAWRIVLSGAPERRFRIEIPADAQGLVRLETVQEE